MGNVVNIDVISRFNPRGVNAAVQAYQKAEKALAGLNRAGGGGNGAAQAAAGQEKLTGASTRAAGTAQNAAKAAQQAERALLQEAQALARLQQATGQSAAAQQTLTSALAKVDGSSKAAISAQTQLAQIQNKTASAAQRAGQQQEQAATRAATAQDKAASAAQRAGQQQEQAATRAAKAQEKAAAAATRSAQQQAAAAQRGQAQALGLAQAQARAAVAAGKLSQAESILASALAKVDGSTRPAIAAQTQLTQIQTKAAAAANANADASTGGASKLAGWIGPAKGAMLALGGVAVALAGINSAAQAIKGVADYESSMAMLKVSSSASADEMERAGAKAKALAADLSLPATSAAGAANAILELVKGGLSLNQSLDASKGTLQLAAAGMLDEATAAEYVTAALNGFALKGEQAVMVADQFAAGAAATSLDVKDMADSLRQGGGLFASYQVRAVGGAEALTQFNTAVGVLATQGIKGQQAGTYIATAMERMARPTEEAKGKMEDLAKKIGISGDIAYDAQGKMRPFEEIMRNVAAATADMTEKERDATIGMLFMTEGAKAVNPILNSMQESAKGTGLSWDEIKEKTTVAGAASLQAAAQMAGLNGAVAGLQSQVETLAQAGLEPFLPLMARIVAGAAELAGMLADQVGPAAIALAGPITALADFIQANAVPAIQALGMAAVAYAVMQAPAMIAAVASATQAFIANAAGMALAAAPYALIAAAIGGMAYAFKNYEDTVDGANKKMLEGKSWWQQSTAALETYDKAQLSTNKNVAAAASTVNILRGMIEGETKALAERRNAGMSDGEYQAELNRINQHAAGLQDATANLERLTQAEVEHAAAGASATSMLASQAEGISKIGEAAALSADDFADLQKQLTDITDQGGAAFAKFADTEQSYMDGMAERQQSHADKIAELQEKLGEAKTAKQREAVEKEIAAVQEGYAKQEQEQALSYARQQAAQNAALGQMLLNYTANQVAMGNISTEQGNKIAAAITDQFGITESTSQATFLKMAGHIDSWAQSGTSDASILTNALTTTQGQAIATQSKMAALERRYTAEVLTTMAGQPPEAIAAALRAIPARVYSEVVINTRMTGAAVGGSATAGRTEWEREFKGGKSKAAGGGTFLTDGPTTLTVGDNPGGVEKVTVEPVSGKGSTVVGAGMARLAGGGTVIATGDTAPAASTTRSTRSTRSARAPRKTEAQREAEKQTKEAEKTADKLLDIQQKASEKLIDIQQKTAERLADIDKRAAQQQLENRRKLDQDIAADHSQMLADMEADDLDFYDKGADKKELQQREQQQAQYRQMMERAQDEARSIAQDDAQLAKDTLAIREAAAQKRMQLDARYNEVAAQASKKDKAKLKEQYDQAVAAQDAATQTKLDIAQQEAQQRKDAQAEEKASVVADSREQASQVINDAIDTAAQVEGATTRQRNAVILSLADQQNAAGSWSSAFHAASQQIVSDSKTASDAIKSIPTPPSSSGSSTGTTTPATGNRAAGGGEFVTNGPTTLTVGDNPGGVEKVTVTPISGVGQTQVGGNLAKMAGGGTIWTKRIEQEQRRKNAMATGGSSFDLSEIDPANLDTALGQLNELSRIVDAWARKNKVDPGVAKKFADTVKIVSDAVSSVAAVRATIGDLGPVIDLAQVDSLVSDMVAIVGVLQREITKKGLNVGLLKEYADATGSVVDVLNAMADVRKDLADLPPPIDVNIIAALAEEARIITRIVQYELVKLYQEERDALSAMGESLDNVVGILKSVIDLRDSVKDLGPPLLLETVGSLADEASAVLLLIVDRLQPITRAQSSALEQVAEDAEHATGILTGMAELRAKLAEPTPPIPASLVAALVAEALNVRAQIVALLPAADATAAGLEAYATAFEQSAGIVQRMAELRETLSALSSPIDLKAVDRLAAEAYRVTIRLYADVIPYTQQQVAGLQAYGAVNEGAVEALQRMAELAKTLAEPTVPIDMKVVDYLAAVARQVAMRLYADVIPYTEQQQAGFEGYSRILTGSVDILSKIATLGKDIDAASPIDLALVSHWSGQARRVAEIVQQDLLPVSEEEAAAFERYSQAQGNSVDIISRTAKLGTDMKDARAISDAEIQMLAATGRRVLQIVTNELVPTAEAEADAMSRYSDAQGKAVDVISNTAGLGKDLAEAQPFSEAQVRRVAGDASRVLQIVRGQMVPIAEAEADAVGRWSDAQGNATEAIKNTLGLTGTMFADYVSPSDAQLNLALSDADRLILGMTALAGKYQGPALSAAKEMAEAITTTVGALTETGKLVEAMRYGNDYQIDAKVLAQFETGASTMIAVGGRLGAQAAAVSASDMAALSGAASTMAGVGDAMAKIAAVPVGNLPSTAGALSGLNFGALGFGGSTTTNTTITIAPGAIVIQGSPGMDVTALANATLDGLDARLRSYR